MQPPAATVGAPDKCLEGFGPRRKRVAVELALDLHAPVLLDHGEVGGVSRHNLLHLLGRRHGSHAL